MSRTDESDSFRTCFARRAITAAVVVLAAGGASYADARITGIVIDCARSQSPTKCPGQSPTFGGLSFGSVGQYQKLRGTAFGELHPQDEHNAIIKDIELAPRNAAGRVEYSMDIFILKPVNLADGNHRVLLDFNNRGEMRLGRLNDVALTNDPTTAAHAGNGFVMNLGYTVVGNGWDVGATGFDDMKIVIPVAKNPDGSSIVGPSYQYLVNDSTNAAQRMTFPLTYPAANPADQGQATLTVRMRLDDTPTIVPASGWAYTTGAGTAIQLLPAGTAFQQSAIYEFTYLAKDPAVAAIGLAATRDFISFLRHASLADGNPLAGDVQHTYSYSISQPSRTLNDFQYLGFNEDEDGRRVLDGILSHTGGGSGDQINYRFAQPGRTERNRQNHLYPEGVFPFAHQVLTDRLSGITDGRSARCTKTHTCPKRFEVNTSNEYWVKAGSLLHSDTRGRDLKDPEHVRFYLMSGQSHGVGDVTTRSICQQFLNPVSPYPAHRALLVALDQWVREGIKPPKSEVPEDRERAFAVTVPGSQTGFVPQRDLGWPDIPGVIYNGVITTRYFLDFGPDFRDGVLTNYPPSLTGRRAYPIFVSKVDKDGNEIAGIRMPEVEAPIATTTGWALRRAGFSENEGCEANGQWIPFYKTKDERLAARDPRGSLEERYHDHEGYVRAIEKAARKLEHQRFLLPEDVKRYVEEAQASDILR